MLGVLGDQSFQFRSMGKTKSPDHPNGNPRNRFSPLLFAFFSTALIIPEYPTR